MENKTPAGEGHNGTLKPKKRACGGGSQELGPYSQITERPTIQTDEIRIPIITSSAWFENGGANVRREKNVKQCTQWGQKKKLAVSIEKGKRRIKDAPEIQFAKEREREE